MGEENQDKELEKLKEEEHTNNDCYSNNGMDIKIIACNTADDFDCSLIDQHIETINLKPKNNEDVDVELMHGVLNLQIEEMPAITNTAMSSSSTLQMSQKTEKTAKRKFCWDAGEEATSSSTATTTTCHESLMCKCVPGKNELCSNCFLPQRREEYDDTKLCSPTLSNSLPKDTLSDNLCSCKNTNKNVPICEDCFLLRENLTLGSKRKSDEGCHGLHMQISESEELLDESTKWLSTSPCCIKKPKIPVDINGPLLESVIDDLEIDDDITSNDDELVYDIELDEKMEHSDLIDNIQLVNLDNDVATIKLDIIESNSCPFDILPAELKLKIFSYFTQRELCRYIAPVCSHWFHLSKDISFWQHLDTTNNYADVASDLMVRVIVSWCKNITNLELNKRDTISTTEFCEIFQNCPNIQYLSIAFCSQIDDEILTLIGTYCKKLKGITLEGCPNVTDESFYKFIGLPLNRVNVSHCNMLSDDGGMFLVRNFKNLVEVNFDGIQWMSEDFVKLLVETHHKTLERVYMDGENLGDDAIRNLSRCRQLKALSFSFCTLMSHNSVEWVGQCDKIEHLRLRKGSNFTNTSLLNYLNNMSVHQGLNFSYLCLAECTELSDKCLFHLSEKCPNLKVLDLSWCWEVSDNGLAHIIDNCQRLKELHLKGLHELYGTPFFHLPKSVPCLLFLDLSQCNKVQDELIKYIVDKMTELIVHNYYGEMVINARRHDVSKYLDT